MNNNINLKPTEKMGYINFWCQKVIPLVFDDSLSYYEAICKFMQNVIGRENKNKSDLKQKRYERCYEATIPCENIDMRL